MRQNVTHRVALHVELDVVVIGVNLRCVGDTEHGLEANSLLTCCELRHQDKDRIFYLRNTFFELKTAKYGTELPMYPNLCFPLVLLPTSQMALMLGS